VGLKPSASLTKATFVACRLASRLRSLAKRGLPNRLEIPVLFRKAPSATRTLRVSTRSWYAKPAEAGWSAPERA